MDRVFSYTAFAGGHGTLVHVMHIVVSIGIFMGLLACVAAGLVSVLRDLLERVPYESSASSDSSAIIPDSSATARD
jgi:hypothetical protein